MTEFTKVLGMFPVVKKTFITLLFNGNSATGKTEVWTVETEDRNTILGEIKWNGAWRCYWFLPCDETGYEKKCLRDLADFCEELTNKQRDKHG